MADVIRDNYSSAPPNAARWTARILGIVLLIVAIWGFLDGNDVLGVFSVNAAHNFVHLISGAVLLGVGFAGESVARSTLWVFAAIYALIMILGFLGVQWIVDTFDMNMADHWLHLLLTAIFAIAALASQAQERARERRERVVSSTTPR